MKLLLRILRLISDGYVNWNDTVTEADRKQDVEFAVKLLYDKVLLQDRKYVEQLAEHLNVKL